VPGAFMSMLGVSYLREIIEKENITEPGKILDLLRENIIEALNQKGNYDEQKDGMDMSLIAINHDTNTLQFSGANNSLYIINTDRAEWPQEAVSFGEGLSGIEIKPNKIPIAIYPKMIKFETIEIKLQENDCLYLFSDGYADQFGGLKNKKFGYRRFREILVKNSNKPFGQQKNILENEFTKWRGNSEQIDDIVIIGLKL
jgi:serine phosphatase RsbU (regulator of sigma subunit)